MSIKIDLEPPAEQALRAQAAKAGISVEEFARNVLERESLRATEYHPGVEAVLRTVEVLRGKIGPVPENACDPQSLYGDR